MPNCFKFPYEKVKPHEPSSIPCRIMSKFDWNVFTKISFEKSNDGVVQLNQESDQIFSSNNDKSTKRSLAEEDNTKEEISPKRSKASSDIFHKLEANGSYHSSPKESFETQQPVISSAVITSPIPTLLEVEVKEYDRAVEADNPDNGEASLVAPLVNKICTENHYTESKSLRESENFYENNSSSSVLSLSDSENEEYDDKKPQIAIEETEHKEILLASSPKSFDQKSSLADFPLPCDSEKSSKDLNSERSLIDAVLQSNTPEKSVNAVTSNATLHSENSELILDQNPNVAKAQISSDIKEFASHPSELVQTLIELSLFPMGYGDANCSNEKDLELNRPSSISTDSYNKFGGTSETFELLAKAAAEINVSKAQELFQCQGLSLAELHKGFPKLLPGIIAASTKPTIKIPKSLYVKLSTLYQLLLQVNVEALADFLMKRNL